MRKINFDLRERIGEIRREEPKKSLAYIAARAGVSRQRVHQILRSVPTEREVSAKLASDIAKAVKSTRKKVEV